MSEKNFSAAGPQSAGRRTALPRRKFLRRSGIALAGMSTLEMSNRLTAAFSKTVERPAPAKIEIDLGERIGRISPMVYGHMAEHIGRLVYDGLWVGVNSPISNIEGIRRAAVETLRRAGASVIRWPGGCFADAYHWKDGIGPREERPRRWNFWWDQPESNAFGTHEFLRLCELVEAEAYLSLNLGSGTIEEAMEWIEYCNSDKDTELTRQRARNGHPRPYGVRYWGIGNESWGCGGVYSADEYARKYLRWALYLRRGNLPDLGPSAVPIELVGVGHAKGDWNQQFLEGIRDYPMLIDHLSIHHYFRKQGQPLDMSPDQIPEVGDVRFGENEYYWLIDGIRELEGYVETAIRLLSTYFGDSKKVGLMVDEWGSWYPQAMVSTEFFQQNTVRDAVLAGSVLNFFNRQCRHITMANIAQSFNIMQAIGLTRGEQLVLTPTFYVMEMYRPHQGAELVQSRIDSPSHETGAGRPQASRETVSVSSSIRRDRLFLTVVNEDLSRDVECELSLVGGIPKKVHGTLLTAAKVQAHNTFEDPQRVVPRAAGAALDGKRIRFQLPAHSVSGFEIELA